VKKIASNKTLLVQKAAAINEHILKRGFDFLLLVVPSLHFSWLYPIIALLIKLETNGLLYLFKSELV
jgi:lipopolysaccharide/colanic/teichoic acid biosynthesis glycosyltransferase